MPTALQVAESTEDFLAGRDPGVEYRSKYNKDNIVGHQPGGSQNIPLLHARNALIYNFYQHKDKANKDILDAWVNYAKGDFMTSEAFSCNIYFAWILESIGVAHAAAIQYGHEAELGLAGHLGTGIALCSLASGWKPNTNGFDGYPCVMTGMRSWNGPARYMTSASSFGSGWLAQQLGFSNMSWLYKGLTGLFSQYEFPIVDIEPFRRIVRNEGTNQDYEEMSYILDNGPRARVSARLIRTDKSVFWGNLNSVNTGSTCCLPGKGWTTGANPYRHHDYSPDATSMWVSVDRPRRNWGVAITGVFAMDDGEYVYSAQRVGQRRDKDIPRNSYWDEEISKDIMGWRYCLIPGKPLVELDISPRGYILGYNGDVTPPPPPPPPDSGAGWHTVNMDNAYLKFTDAEAEAALAVINTGGNHLPIHSVAFEPEELAELKYELERL